MLQGFPSQKKSLLVAIGGVDPLVFNIVVVNDKNHTPKLLPQLEFMIQLIVRSKTIHRTIIDEGTSTCIMSLSCWKAIGSPKLNQPLTTLKDFYGIVFKPCRILNSLQVKSSRKIVSMEFEVINRSLDYNLLLD